MKLTKVIAALCSVTMMCTSVAFAAPGEISENSEISLFAVGFDGGDGTEANPYLISTEKQLEFVADIPNKCFKLTNDIELQKDWTPIGTYGEAFSGTFDGDGFTISNMVVVDGNGFFKEVTGNIKNLNIEGTVTSSSEYAGGIAGKSSGNFENCNFSGDIMSTNSSTSYTGGLIGNVSEGIINNCSSSGNIQGNSRVGGLIGWVGSQNAGNAIALSNCSATGNVQGGSYAGGLVGYIYNRYYSTKISNCFSTSDVQGSMNVGGLAGYMCYSNVEKSYSTGNITPTEEKYDSAGGGLIGYLSSGDVSLCYACGNVNTYKDDKGKIDNFTYGAGLVGYTTGNCSIENSYARGSVNATTGVGLACANTFYDSSSNNYRTTVVNSYSAVSINATHQLGMIIDINSYTTKYPPLIKNSYYDSGISGCTDTNCGSSPKTTSGMKNQLVYEDWDFEDIWAIDESETINDGYPYLRWELEKKVKVNKITLDKNAEVKMGATITLEPVIDGENVEGVPLVWTSNDRSVAIVDNGIVTGKNIGTAVISVFYGSLSANCTVTVLDNTVKVESVTLDKSNAGIVIGETLQLTANVVPEDATNKNIKWTSSNADIASVSNKGLVTGLAEGTTQIYATSESNNSCYSICDVTVAKQKVSVTGIEFSGNLFGEPYEVNIGKALILSPTIKPSNATNKDIRWTSSNSDIATVVNGKVTGIAEGTATITATTADGGYSASVSVKVTKPTVYVTGIALNTEQMTVDVKKTKKLTAAVTPLDATDKTITFKSNNNAIANVTADGTVTGVSPGTTLIQAISDTSSGKFIAFCTVTVPKPVVEVTSVKLDKGSLEIVEGKTVPLKAIIKPTNATYKNITWSASDESVVTVSQDGYVTARGVGEAVVSATAVNGVNVICNVTVLSSDTPAQLKVENATVKAGKQVPVTVSIASNPGISTFNFDLKYDKTKMYPVSYTQGAVLENVNVITPLGSQSFKDKDSVRFLCSTKDSKDMDSDGDLITVVFQTLSDIEYGEETIEIIPTAFTNQNYEAINLQSNNCTLQITDYIIGDVNNDDVVDLKDSMVLGQYIAGFGNELTPQGKKAAVSIYPDENDNVETSEPSLNDFQHLFRYLADWQVELGKK